MVYFGMAFAENKMLIEISRRYMGDKK